MGWRDSLEAAHSPYSNIPDQVLAAVERKLTIVAWVHRTIAEKAKVPCICKGEVAKAWYDVCLV
ncbi:hypothetical protein N7462_011168 [Penicillium macrosclerotiorum]|uniref:uncharacterized protein n=1 Tax=Penicillium macrosclerotiorum TaxID=303699 RepID=UPI00254823D5|nr:uncharacterized protein N7462_011168 [Penicillium macrosclerotiorum]KAJ5666759.1 hypothetical protein N7462_011168 [Penicillium macrosclerotiorum]